jgi:hypothetical protein
MAKVLFQSAYKLIISFYFLSYVAKRVMSFIHPFVAHFDPTDPKKYQIRLTHQSVKEIILKTELAAGRLLPRLNQPQKMEIRTSSVSERKV